MTECEWTDFQAALLDFCNAVLLAYRKDPDVFRFMHWMFKDKSHIEWTEGTSAATRYETLMTLQSILPLSRLHELAAIDNLCGHLNQRIGVAGWLSIFPLTVDGFAWKTVEVAVLKTESGMLLDESVICSRISALRSLLESDNLSVELIGLIDPVYIEDEVIDLESEIRVAALNDTQILSMVENGIIPVNFEYPKPPFALIRGGGRAGIVHCLSLPKVVGVSRLTDPFDYAAQILGDFESVADAIAVALGRRPRLVGWYHHVANVVLAPTVGSRRIFAPDDGQAPIIALYDADEIAIIHRQIAMTRRSKRFKSLGLAVHRVGLAASRESTEDVLLDIVIAAEALLLQSSERESELGFRAALRGAQWWAQSDYPPDPRFVFTCLRKGYDVRSQMVHGADTGAKSEYMVAGSKMTFQELVDALFSIIRTLTREGLRLLERSGRVSPEWTEELDAHLRLLRADGDSNSFSG